MKRLRLYLPASLVILTIGAWIWHSRSGPLAPDSPPRVRSNPAQSSQIPPAPALLAPPSDKPIPASSSVQPGIPVRFTTSSAPQNAPQNPPQNAPKATPAADLKVPNGPPAVGREARADLENVQQMLRDFRTRMKENPVGSNAEIMRSIMGENPVRAKLGPPEGQTLNEMGELVDRWGTPYFFHQLSKNQMEIRSAGPDQQMWTVDDILVR